MRRSVIVNTSPLTEIRPILEKLKGSGFYLNNKLVTEILTIAGERIE